MVIIYFAAFRLSEWGFLVRVSWFERVMMVCFCFNNCWLLLPRCFALCCGMWGHATDKNDEKGLRSVEMDKVLSKDRWSVPVRVLSPDNTCLCLSVLINTLNIPATLASLILC